MNPEQAHCYLNTHTRNVILKARQLGITTEWAIILLDCAMWESGTCAMIAHKLDDAKRIFREKALFAYENLPEIIRQANPARNERVDELVFERGGSMSISTNFRGGTLTRLHVSEFGYICARNPEKAREIRNGAFEAVSKNATITVESTAEGADGGFFDICAQAEKLQLQGADLGPLDWKFFFYPWWTSKNYQLESGPAFGAALVKYFDELEVKHDIHLTEQQKYWYAAKQRDLGDDVTQEYPSYPAEAFRSHIEGSYYSTQFRNLYRNNRIGALPDNRHLPVYTFWDIGVGDSTAIWFIRMVGNEYHVIDFYENSGEGLRHYMKVLKSRGYTYAGHVGPHDIDNREFGSDAKSRRQLAREGYEIDGERYSLRFEVVPRGSINGGIESVREILPKCVFNETACKDGIKALESYRKEWDEKRGTWRDSPLHDWSSHGADAFRTFAVHVINRKQRVVNSRIGVVY